MLISRAHHPPRERRSWLSRSQRLPRSAPTPSSFGPQTYTRGERASVAVTKTFNVTRPSGLYCPTRRQSGRDERDDRAEREKDPRAEGFSRSNGDGRGKTPSGTGTPRNETTIITAGRAQEGPRRRPGRS